MSMGNVVRGAERVPFGHQEGWSELQERDAVCNLCPAIEWRCSLGQLPS